MLGGMPTSPAFDWWSFQGYNHAYWFGAIFGGLAGHYILVRVWMRAGLGPIAAAIACMFTSQAIGACGSAPEPLMFHEVATSAVTSMIWGLWFWGKKRQGDTQASPRVGQN